MSAPNDIASPFKFLRSYDRTDGDFFFGRENETLQLYKLIRGYRAVVVFGPSGSGKTSLIKCGLDNYQDPMDWFPVYLRRGNGFINSLADELKANQVWQEGSEPAATVEQIGQALIRLGKSKLRPVYLIFDQFEELLILGTESEYDQMIALLKLILTDEDYSFCNIILSIREEYIGSMEPIAVEVPGLLDNRLRLQSILRDMAREVITQSCRKFEISIDDETVEAILEKLDEKGVVQLTYLQVYLDQLWRADFARTWEETGGQVERAESGFYKLEFSSAEIAGFGEMKDVIQRFLSEQSVYIEQSLGANPHHTKGMLDKILNCLVTEEGTKLPIGFSRTGDRIKLEGENLPAYLKTLEATAPELLSHYFLQLEESRIITSNKNHYELAHDKIAELILQKRKKEELNRKETIQKLELFKERKTHLTPTQLREIEDVIPSLDSNSPEVDFYLESKRRNTTKRIFIFVSLLVLAIVVLTFVVLGLRDITNQLYAIQTFDRTIPAISDKDAALSLANYIYSKDDDPDYRRALEESYSEMFRQPEVQAELSVMNQKLPLSYYRRGDFHISDKGDFLVVKTLNVSESYGNFALYGKDGKLIEEFTDNINYVYFLNQPDILLVAIAGDEEWHTSVFTSYPSKFYLYNCRERKRVDYSGNGNPLIDLGNRFLYSSSQLVANRSPNDSYRIRFGASGNLLIPFIQLTGANTFIKKVAISQNGNNALDIKSSYPIRLSKDRNLLMTGFRDAEPVREIWKGADKVGTITGSEFADFTESGSLMYIQDGLLKFSSPVSAVPVKEYKIKAGISYAHVGGDEHFAILEDGEEGFYVYDLKKKESQAYKEKLTGFNFKKNVFITLDNSKELAAHHALYRRNFSGSEVDTLSIEAGIRQVVYNDQVDNLLVLDSTYAMHLVDDKLQTKAVYQLSSNDPFGFSRNGKYIYYLRDNWLNLLENKDRMVNLFDFEEAKEWYRQQSVGREAANKKAVEDHLPPRPSARAWFFKKITGFFGN